MELEQRSSKAWVGGSSPLQGTIMNFKGVEIMRPANCDHCPLVKSCQYGMYMEGCAFYTPQERGIGFLTKVKTLVNNIFHSR